MRLAFRILLLLVAVPQFLAAQAPQTETMATQPVAKLTSSSSVPVPFGPEGASTRLASRQTGPLLNFAGIPSRRGEYELFRESGGEAAFPSFTSADSSFTNEARAPAAFRPPLERENAPTRVWKTLIVVQHSAAVFDAWSTRHAIQNGGAHEANPLFRPFAGSNLIYAATQVGPGLLDYLGYRMMRSKKRWVRKLWWLPQLAGTAGSLFSGAHNLSVARGGTTALPR